MLAGNLLFHVARGFFQNEIQQAGNNDARWYRKVGTAVPTSRTGTVNKISRAGATVMIRYRRHPVERKINGRWCFRERNGGTDEADEERDNRVPVEATHAPIQTTRVRAL